MLLDTRPAPIVLAPLAGGPSTPELAAAVSNAGGFGFLAAGYLNVDVLQERIAAVRSQTSQPFGVNVFVPGQPTSPATLEAYTASLADEAQRAGVALGAPSFDDDHWDAKIELLLADPVPVVSFVFGCPDADVVASLREVGSEVWVTVTSAADAVASVHAGADALAVQGGEAGGHRGGFDDASEPIGLLSLLQLLGAAVDVPLVAAGGIATGAAVAAVLAAGARAAAVGTAFLRCPEAGTSAVQRAALTGTQPTELTRAFTGRTARGIRNRFLTEHSAQAPAGYPEVHNVTAPLRQAGRVSGDVDVVNLWAGQSYPLAEERPAAEIVHTLTAGAIAALETAVRRATLR